jgi:hypothetical protein
MRREFPDSRRFFYSPHNFQMEMVRWKDAFVEMRCSQAKNVVFAARQPPRRRFKFFWYVGNF